MKNLRLGILLTCCVGALSSCDRLESMENGGRYAAKSMCSCLFVLERDEISCAADLIGGADQLPRSIDYDNGSVTAGLPLMRGTANFAEGEGCLLD